MYIPITKDKNVLTCYDICFVIANSVFKELEIKNLDEVPFILLSSPNGSHFPEVSFPAYFMFRHILVSINNILFFFVFLNSTESYSEMSCFFCKVLWCFHTFKHVPTCWVINSILIDFAFWITYEAIFQYLYKSVEFPLL